VESVRAVLDTNVVVSAHLKSSGQEALILALALSGRFEMVVSPALLEEYEGVLRRPRFGFSHAAVRRSMRAIRNMALLVHPRRDLDVALDPDDNKVLECALEGGAEYLVTGNARDFPKQFQGVAVVPPRQFLVILAARLE
jgi:putative PIN family toxin of toxin-antitoxin system